MPVKKLHKTLLVRVDEEEAEWVEQQASAAHRSVSNFVRRMLAQAMDGRPCEKVEDTTHAAAG
jgi:hypothetical protein